MTNLVWSSFSIRAFSFSLAQRFRNDFGSMLLSIYIENESLCQGRIAHRGILRAQIFGSRGGYCYDAGSSTQLRVLSTAFFHFW